MQNIEFSSPPSLWPLYVKALFKRPSKSHLQPTLPSTVISMNNVTVDRYKIDHYESLCGFSDSAYIPVTYPHLIAFSMHASLLLDKLCPFPLLGLIHIKNDITQHRAIGKEEAMNIECKFGDLLDVDKGTQFDIVTQISINNECVWSSKSTLLYPHKKTNKNRINTTIHNVVNYCNTTPWQLKGDIGRQYAKASGDFNPIHLFAVTARLFGFKKPIAHGMWSKAKAIASLEMPNKPFTVSVDFKRPAFLPSRVTLSSETSEEKLRFMLTSNDNATTHIDGTVTYI
jgi:hypothetical protein